MDPNSLPPPTAREVLGQPLATSWSVLVLMPASHLRPSGLSWEVPVRTPMCPVCSGHTLKALLPLHASHLLAQSCVLDTSSKDNYGYL